MEEIMPMNSVASWIRLTSNEPQQKCIHCNTVCTDKFLTFDKTKYGQNTIVSQMTENDAQNICNKCHNVICRESLVTCLIYTKTVKKMCTLKFDINTYSSLENNIKEMEKSQKTNSYICKSCHVELQQKITCVCCNRHMQKHVCKMYNKVDYDFTNSVVSQYLQHVSNFVHEEQYICSSCDKGLKGTSDENPVSTILCQVCKCSHGSKLSEGTESKTWICVHILSLCYFIKLYNSLTWKTMI